MIDTVECVKLLYESELHSIEWIPFSSEAQLVFITESGPLRLTFSGIHAFLSRQAINRKYSLDSHSLIGCCVDYLAFHEESKLLSAFLDQKIFDETHIALYDANRKKRGESGFIAPSHFVMCCSEGMLDIIYESIAISIEVETN